MKTFGVFLVGLLAIGATSARAQVKCGLFSPDPTCQPSSGPQVQVDFAKGQRFERPVRPPFRQATEHPVVGTPAKPAIDCQMIRSADRNLDPRMVKAPPSGVKYALRIIEAPPCPVK